MNKEEKQLYIQGVFGLVEFPPRIMFKDWCIINSEKRKLLWQVFLNEPTN